MGAYHLHWSHGQATVLTTAAMLGECRFTLPNGSFSPFACAPWMGSIEDKTISGHLRELGGDFACLPFGIGREIRNPPQEWASTHSFTIIPGTFPYRLAKHALLGMTRSLALEYASHGVRVNAMGGAK